MTDNRSIRVTDIDGLLSMYPEEEVIEIPFKVHIDLYREMWAKAHRQGMTLNTLIWQSVQDALRGNRTEDAQ